MKRLSVVVAASVLSGIVGCSNGSGPTAPKAVVTAATPVRATATPVRATATPNPQPEPSPTRNPCKPNNPGCDR